ncbi:MAG: M13 family metallopeptidase N-terminal domain-containing protein, partial [Verrucomicrobiota bacterium]
AILHQILDEAAAGAATAAKGSAAQKIGDFYASGMDEAAVNADGIKPLQGELDAIAALAKPEQLPSAIARLHRLGLGGLFQFYVDQDEKNSSVQIVQISQGGLGLPDRDYYFKDDARSKDLRAKYEAHLEKMFVILGEPAEKAAASAASVMKFETELAKSSKTRVELRDPEGNYHKMPLADLSSIAKGFDWALYFQALGAPQPGEIDVRQPAFFTRIGEIAGTLPLEEWKTYLRWHLIHNAAADLSAPFVEEDFRFYSQILTGAKEIRPRWKRILKETNSVLGEALGQIYVEKHFAAESKERCLTMVEDLRTVLGERIRKLDWMGPETKVAALKKLAAFGVKIGYPDKWRDYSPMCSM